HKMALPLGHALALTATADLFVGVDSCFLHAADLARVPSVGLFFATEPHEFGTQWSHHRHLEVANPATLNAKVVTSALEALGSDKRPRSYQPSWVETGRSSRAAKVSEEVKVWPAIAGRICRDRWISSVGLGTARFCFDRETACHQVVEKMLALGCNVI